MSNDKNVFVLFHDLMKSLLGLGGYLYCSKKLYVLSLIVFVCDFSLKKKEKINLNFFQIPIDENTNRVWYKIKLKFIYVSTTNEL